MYKTSFNDGWIVSNILPRHSGLTETREAVTLPHDATIHTPRNPDSKGHAHSGCWDGGEYRYEKRFVLPADDADKILMLEFEGVYMNAMVYVNNDFAGKCPNGYTNFYIPLNDFVRFGQENTITVYVKSGAMPNSRWYTGSGIYRPVYLYVANRLYLPENGVRFTTEEVRNGSATVSVSTTIQNAHASRRSATLLTRILDPNGREVASDRIRVTCFPDQPVHMHQRMIVDDAQLWQEGNPALYTVESQLFDGDALSDEHRFQTGIRTLSLNSRDGLCVNGKTVKLRGACIHHTSGFLGAATFACEEERKIRLLQKAGFNAIRISHQPCSKDMLDACDRLGMYVMEESFDQWNWCKVLYDYGLSFNEWWERDVQAFVDKDFNHPSVLFYSIGNEIREVVTSEGARQARMIAEKIRSLDSTRYVTNAINGMLCCMDNFDRFLPEDEIQRGGDEINSTLNLMERSAITTHPEFTSTFEESTYALDIIGYNYMQRRYDLDCPAHPNRIYLGSETFPKDIGYNWERVRKYPNLIGDFTWTGMEYLGEAGIARHEYRPSDAFYGAYPNYFSGSGDISLVGDRLPISYYRETVFGLRKDPYIAVWLPEHYGETHTTSVWGWSDVVHNWRWPGFEGKPVRMEVYSDADTVELLLNGSLVDRQHPENCIATFECNYAPGTLTAIAYTDGRETGRQVLQTAGDQLRLHAEADQSELRAGAQDLARIQISLTDEAGRLRMDADRKVRLQVEGDGCLAGFGSADPLSTEEIYESERTLYRGRALAYIRSDLEAGRIRIRISCEGMEDQSIEIDVH